MTVYWQSTKAPVHLFKRAYESEEVAAHVQDYSFVDSAMLASELKTAHLSRMAVEAYQRRLGVRKITENNPRGKR
jgi:hypothetical protein